MRSSILVLATFLSGILTVAAAAENTRLITQTAAIETEDEARNLGVQRARETDGADRHLSVSEGIVFEPFDPAFGRLKRVRVDMQLYVEQGFSGTIGDGMPLDEEPDPVAIKAKLATRLDVVGPDGGFLASEVVESKTAGCASQGTCAFAHHERHAVTIALDAPLRAFSGEGSAKLIIRGTTIGGVLSQICSAKGSWDRCQIRQARIGVTVPKAGVRVSYEYVPAPTRQGAGVRPAPILVGIGAAVVASAFVGLATVLYRRRRHLVH